MSYQKTITTTNHHLPPIEIQNKIAAEVSQRIEKARQLRNEAEELLEEAKARVEGIILGESNS